MNRSDIVRKVIQEIEALIVSPMLDVETAVRLQGMLNDLYDLARELEA